MVTATGQRGDDGWVVLTRTVRARVEEVWAWVTEPSRLHQWIGTWTGEPTTGSVSFRMTAEGDDVAEERIAVEECRPPSLLRVTSAAGWQMRVEIQEEAGATTLRFGQRMSDPEEASSVGPGWEYYLDRLVAAQSGQDVAGVRFDDYYPALAGHYRSLLGG